MDGFKDSQYLILGTIGILIISSSMFVYLYSPVSAHNFSINESAAFLAMTDALKAEVQLVQQNLANNNRSMASEHANKALALLSENVTKEIAERNQRLADDLQTALTSIKASTESASSNDTASDISFLVSDTSDIIDEVVSSRVDPEQLNNSTIQALRMVELIDKLLTNYGDAYAVGFDMTNMSMMVMGNNSDEMTSLSAMNMSMDNSKVGNLSSGSMPMNNNISASDITIIDTTDYQTAQALALKIQEIFKGQITNASLSEDTGTASQSIDSIASALQELITNIDSKASPMDVMTIVHTKVHPNFVLAFGLQLG